MVVRYSALAYPTLLSPPFYFIAYFSKDMGGVAGSSISVISTLAAYMLAHATEANRTASKAASVT